MGCYLQPVFCPDKKLPLEYHTRGMTLLLPGVCAMNIDAW